MALTEANVERILADIKNPRNREKCRAFLFKKALKCGLSTRVLRAGHLRSWADHMGERDFDQATEADVLAWVHQREVERVYSTPGGPRPARIVLAQETVNQRIISVRQFQRWIRTGSVNPRTPFPDEVKEVVPLRTRDHKLPVEAILTPEEIRKLIEVQRNPHDRALIATLADSGFRVGELLSLNVGAVLLDEHGAILALPKGAKGLKTGARRVRVIAAAPYLVAWLNVHPDRDDPRAPLWVSHSDRNGGSRLSAGAVHSRLRASAKRAGLKKDVWPHLFRHTRATQAAKQGWPDWLLRNHFGWTQESEMPSRYVHLAGKDCDEYILRAAGILPEQKDALAAIAVQTCACGQQNSATARFCERPGCHRPLNALAVAEWRRGVIDALLDEANGEEDVQELARRLMKRVLRMADKDDAVAAGKA